MEKELQIMPEFEVNFTKNKDGTCTINTDELTQLIGERNQLMSDITLAANHIGKLLKSLGMMDDEGEFTEPSWGKIGAQITRMMLTKSNSGPFAHMAELAPVLKNYVHTIKQGQDGTTKRRYR